MTRWSIGVCIHRLALLAAILIAFTAVFHHLTMAWEGETWHYLSNEGESALLVKTPNYRSVSNRSEHVAIVPARTAVEVLGTRQDPSLPVFSWSHVRVLEGQHRGKTGWVSSRAVVMTREVRPTANKRLDSDVTARRIVSSSSSDAVMAEVTSETQLRTQPKIRNGEVDAPRLSTGTRLQVKALEPVDDNFGLQFQWWHVFVLDGNLEGLEGWVLDQHINIERPRLPYNSELAFAYAQKFCERGNDCPTGEYNSLRNPITLLGNPTSTDCTHFMAHVLHAGGPRIPGSSKGASCESGLVIRVVELRKWFHDAANRYENVRQVESWEEARRGDYCLLGSGNHVVLLAGIPKAKGGPIYGHANNRCGESVEFPITLSTFFRIENHPAQDESK